MLTPQAEAITTRVAEMISQRLADPDLVAKAVQASEQRATYPFGWGGSSLLAGHAGTSLLFRYAARASGQPAEPWLALAHQHVVEAVRSTHEIPLMDPGLASGTAGLALALEEAVVDDPRYTKVLNSVRDQLTLQVVQAPSWRTVDGVPADVYDLIGGAAGVLTYLGGSTEPGGAAQQAVDRLIDDLAWLCTPTASGRRVWFVPPQHFPAPEYLNDFPHGYVNLGLAHGLPGVLAALSIAWSHGHRRPGMRSTMEQLVDYLRTHADAGAHGPMWGTGVALNEAGDPSPEQGGHSQIAWCYGTPGVARALLHAGDALDDRETRDYATAAFDGVLERVATGWRLPSATLCHGTAGLVMLCAEFADAGDATARTSLPLLMDQLLDHCDPDLMLGVQDFERAGVYLDSPALLTGAAGVALTLWTADSGSDRRWLRALAAA